MTDFCFQQSPEMLTVEQALNKIETVITPISGTETCNLNHGLGRILVAFIQAKFNSPADRNASMDGYAFSSTDLIEPPVILTESGTSWAGNPLQKKILPGQCVRIFTGAVLPEGTDSVIMQEQVKTQGKQIHLPENCIPFQNIREPGEDIRQGELLIEPPKKLRATDLGFLASAGIYEILVARKLKIAFFSTGDELQSIGHALQPGHVYDSNRYTLAGLLNDAAFDRVDLGVLPDNKQIIKAKIEEISNLYDVIISTGGASVGDADFIQQILAEIGHINFWKIAMKPGKPLAFGLINQCYFFGLPGNPVSVITTYHQIVAPALKKLSGDKFSKPITIKALNMHLLKKTPGRQEFQRGILSQTPSGELQVESAGKQGSNILSAASKANCYIVLPAKCTGIEAGAMVTVQPFDNCL
jgi:molybdopterin molybdotransferase